MPRQRLHVQNLALPIITTLHKPGRNDPQTESSRRALSPKSSGALDGNQGL
ncbi:hypothetical protein [Arthrobacter gyeryongensis]|uniref:hypothetical protein n=1 Tax=Arthrobacter gyeryongensis TaxID=1650592 RepID=UPI0031EFF6AB